MELLDRPFDNYDLLTFVAAIVLAIVIMALFMFVMGLPGRIAIQRKHPHAESVKIMGWSGFLAVVPWMHAFLWAFHDSMTVDVRRFPKEEEKAVRREIARLKGEPIEDDTDQSTTAKDA